MKNSQVKQFIETNKQIQKFMLYLIDKYDFSLEEKVILTNADKHFDNLNIIFSKVKK